MKCDACGNTDERGPHTLQNCNDALRAKRDELARSLAASQRAKAENDERYMLERDEARSQRDELAREVARQGEIVKWYELSLETLVDGDFEDSKEMRGYARLALNQVRKLGAALRGGPAPSGGGEEKP